MSSRARLVLLCLLGIGVNLAILWPALGFTAGGVTDFMDLYAGGKLAFTGHLYSVPHVLATESQTEGWSSPTRLFMRLPCFALFYWSLAQLPYQVASAVWEMLCVLSVAGFVWLMRPKRRSAILLACCWSLPVWMTIAEGQDIGFILLAVAGASALLRRGSPVAAGLVASFCLAKFHLFLLIPVWIIARRQWNFAAGLAAGSALLSGLSFAAGGPSWPLDYWRLLREPANNPYGEVMPNLYALFSTFPNAVAWDAVAILILGAVVWMISRMSNPRWGIAAALTAGILAAPHVYMADAALLIPALIPGLVPIPGPDRKHLARAFSWFLLSPLPWMLLMVGSSVVARLALIGFVFSLIPLPGWFYCGARRGGLASGSRIQTFRLG